MSKPQWWSTSGAALASISTPCRFTARRYKSGAAGTLTRSRNLIAQSRITDFMRKSLIQRNRASRRDANNTAAPTQRGGRGSVHRAKVKTLAPKYRTELLPPSGATGKG
jgi:hypothetical protein